MESLKNVKNKLQEKKLWEPLTYLIFGGLTTLVNLVVYFLFREIFDFHYMIANVISWAASVLFAFFTNKIWVFEAKVKQKRIVACLLEVSFLQSPFAGIGYGLYVSID